MHTQTSTASNMSEQPVTPGFPVWPKVELGPGLRLYHGTSGRNLKSILQDGIVPRGDNPSNWAELPSRSDMVYLSGAFPFFYTTNPADGADDLAVVFEVEIAQLGETNLYPDEDWLATVHPMKSGKSLKEAVLAVGQEVLHHGNRWQASVRGIGGCAYRGVIPPTAITRYCVFDPKSGHRHVPSLSQSASVMTYLAGGGIACEMVRWMFGDVPTHPRATELQFDVATFPAMYKSPRQREIFDSMVSGLSDRTGIEVHINSVDRHT